MRKNTSETSSTTRCISLNWRSLNSFLNLLTLTRFSRRVCFEELLYPWSIHSYNLHRAFSYHALVFLGLLGGREHPTRLYSHPGLSCHLARERRKQWLLCGTLGGRWRRKWELQREKGWTGIERDWYWLRERVKKRGQVKREIGEMEWVSEGAASSLQSRSWPPSSSAEHSSALGEEERVGSPLRPLSGHTVRLEAGLCDGGPRRKYY